jgi:hypothetical protein
LTICPGGIKVFLMKVEIEPMQQPVHKVVGRPISMSRRLANVEDLNRLIKKHTHAAFAKPEGDYFPVRKVVGRPRG